MNFHHLRLGKKIARHDPRTLSLADVMTMPAAPPARDWTSELPEDLGMLANDRLGDCAIAAPAHLLQVWTENKTQPADVEVVLEYGNFGYDPKDPASDNGCVLLDVLARWRKVGLFGHQIGAFAKIDPANIEHVKMAIEFGGGVLVGAMLPVSAQSGVRWTGPEKITSPGDFVGSWGGHAMAVAKYDARGPSFLTWGRRQPADWRWWELYVDEAYALFSLDWIKDGKAPDGLDVSKIRDYLARL